MTEISDNDSLKKNERLKLYTRRPTFFLNPFTLFHFFLTYFIIKQSTKKIP